ncbi:alanine dehydrogenase [Ignavigranum ruoffiae]|uniref:alanine dehydrogenase n=1 Tax=Ignavigranum ruoffiae TaxID=89093 RepID=UPI003B00F26D
MIIGVPEEIKDNEKRVGLVPANVQPLVDAGHRVLIQAGAGVGSGFPDQDYIDFGAEICPVDQVWQEAEMIVKVKEPLESEYKYFRPGLIILTYLHLAANEPLVEAMIEHKVIGIAYETMVENGKLPLLQPMSEIAGRFAIQAGAFYLEQQNGGKGKLLAGVPGVARGKVVVIGGGNVGESAAKIALGMGAEVKIFDINTQRLAELENIFNNRVQTLVSSPVYIAEAVAEADLVIGCVLVAGRRAPVLVSEDMVKTMEPGSVIIDIAIDQGGNIETSTHPTTLSDPIYKVHDVIHYTVANVPGAVPQTASQALTNASARFVTMIANQGLEQAIQNSETVALGVNIYQGHLTHEGVAETSQFPYTDLKSLL